MSKTCPQCESNARTNEACGAIALAKECRDYCARGHMSKDEFELKQRGDEYAHAVLINRARPTNGWTDNVLAEELSRAYLIGFVSGQGRPRR